jgi:tRNA acetyltransferase TAN1
MPIQKVVHTDLAKIKSATEELATKLNENDSFRVTVEKRFTSIHSHEIIEAVASDLKNEVDLVNPNKVFLVEVLGGFTGISLIKPDGIISVLKEKML